MSFLAQMREAGAGKSRPGRLGLLMIAAVVVAIFAFLVREVVDADTWWQVAIGRDILARMSVPHTDHFAAAAMGRPYHDSHWLFQVLLALVDRLGGMAAVAGSMVLLWSATFFFSYRAVCRRVVPEIAILLVFLAAMACSDRFTPRPDVVTCLMIALYSLLLQDGRFRSAGQLVLFALLQVVWSNSHGLFVIGPFMAGCYLLAAVLRRLRSGEGGELTATARLFAVVTLATLATPFGLGGWRYAFLLAHEAGPAASEFFRSLAELAPTFSPRTMALPDFWAYAVVLLLAGLTTVPLLAKGKVHGARLLIVFFLGAAAATGRRNIPLFVLAATPFIAENTALLLPRLRLSDTVKAGAALLILALAWFPLSGSYYRWLNYPQRFGLGASASFFPPGLADFVRRTGGRGQLYNGNYLGGFCLYHGIRPLVDGRWEVYDADTLRRIFAAPFDRQEWGRLVATYDIDAIVLLHNSPEARGLLPRLPGDPLWRLVYYDQAASFWMRTDRGSLPPAADITTTLSGSASPRRVEDYLALATFFRLIGAPQGAIRCLDGALALGEKREAVLEQLGKAQSDLGRSREAEETFRTLLAEHGRNVTALNELAFLAYGRGDLAGAEAYLRRALAVSPEDADVRANLERVANARRMAR